MNILITGGAGFIGSHLVDKLLALKNKVIAIDNFDPFYEKEIKEQNIKKASEFDLFKLYKVDILDKIKLNEIFKENEIEIIIHLAAKAGVRPSIIKPLECYKTNVEGTLNLLECCKDHNIDKFIFASTSSIYGNNQKVPFSENDPVDNPISPYAATKKGAELLCHNYYHLYGINMFCLRFFTVYGPRQRPDLAIHKFFNLMSKNEEIPLFGDGSTSRDYTFIDDIIDGVLKSIKKIKGYEIINLGESETISLLGLVSSIEEIMGKKAKRQFLPMQPGDVNRTYADISKAKKILDYNPSTKFFEGLEIFYNWFKQNN